MVSLIGNSNITAQSDRLQFHRIKALRSAGAGWIYCQMLWPKIKCANLQSIRVCIVYWNLNRKSVDEYNVNYALSEGNQSDKCDCGNNLADHTIDKILHVHVHRRRRQPRCSKTKRIINLGQERIICTSAFLLFCRWFLFSRPHI